MRTHVTPSNDFVHPLANDDGSAVVSSLAIGEKADTAATSDTGTFSLIALVKRLLVKLPAALGRGTAAASFPVVLASDQTLTQLPASVGQKAAAASLPVVLASDQTLPLPAGAATEATLTAQSAKLPASLGQKAAAASLAVVVASDQSPRATAVASIPNGTSVSGVVDLLNTALLAFIAPSAWTAAALNIEVSMTGGASASEWVTAGLFDASSTASGNYPSLTAGAAYAVDTLTLLPFRYVRLRSGTLASPVNQAAQRDFTLITRPLA